MQRSTSDEQATGNWAPSSVSGRLGREYLAQGLSFAVTLFDRLLLAAVLVRLLGVDDFAAWSVAAAAGGMVALFDFGLNLYFSNRISFAVERGRLRRALHAYRAGNLLIFAASALGVFVIGAGFFLHSETLGVTESSFALGMTMVLLVLGNGVRMAMSVHQSLYRAHRQFARQSLLLGGADLFRVIATIVGAVVGRDIFSAALGFFLASLAGYVLAFLLDSRRRFPSFRFGFERPNRAERRTVGPISFGYWVQGAPTTILTFAPVFALASFGMPAAAITQFVLIRTLSNFGRAGLQLFGVVLGQEAARRVALRDQVGLSAIVRESSLLLAVQSGGAVGLVLALGHPLFEFWTGHADLFSRPMLVWAMAPLLFAPTLVLAHNLFASANLPWPMAQGRLLQLLLTIMLFVFLPTEPLPLRAMVALAVGEIAGFGIPVSIALHRLVPGASWLLAVELALRNLVAAAMAFAAAAAVYGALGAGLWPVAAGVSAGLLAMALAIVALGLTASRRAALLQWARTGFGSTKP